MKTNKPKREKWGEKMDYFEFKDEENLQKGMAWFENQINKARQEEIEEAINVTKDILIRYQGLYDESPMVNEALNRVISELKKKVV